MQASHLILFIYLIFYKCTQYSKIKKLKIESELRIKYDRGPLQRDDIYNFKLEFISKDSFSCSASVYKQPC